LELVGQIENNIWLNYTSYKNARSYIKKWHKQNDYWENFKIYESEGKIDLNETLHNIDSETIMKIAIDLGIETPDFIPVISAIKNVLKDKYSKAFDSFQKALKQIEESPDLAIGAANSTLESIIKHILENDNITIKYNKKDSLYALTQSILKEFSLFPNQQMPDEIRNIGSGLLNVAQNIEKLRSEKTTFHGKAKKDYIVEDSLYSYFIVNVISSIGLFIISFYEKKYNTTNLNNEGINNTPESTIDDIPF